MKINKKLFYILNLTWGLPLTLIGALVTFVLFLAGYRQSRHGGCFYTTVGGNWGGQELGLFFLCGENSSKHIKDHEYGHGIQNCIWGPLMIFVICIPSAIRCWYFEWCWAHGKKTKEYDSIWFEGQATRWGEETSSQWEI